MKDLHELRLPAPQRNWVGMGAAAGIAAAFIAPLGGILYSFEEVCSHWSHALTWRSLACTIIVVATYALLAEVSSEVGSHSYDSFVIGLDGVLFRADFTDGNAGWVVILAILGGLIGAGYNLSAFGMIRMRQALHKRMARCERWTLFWERLGIAPLDAVMPIDAVRSPPTPASASRGPTHLSVPGRSSSAVPFSRCSTGRPRSFGRDAARATGATAPSMTAMAATLTSSRRI